MRPLFLSIFLVCAAVLFPAQALKATAPTQSHAAPARFSIRDVPADGNSESLLTIPAAGRYAIRAKSASGARIELVDMIAGPLNAAGAAGLRDGRIDALLDAGAYKLRITGAKGASGKIALAAEPFIEAETTHPALAFGRIESAELTDMRQRSYRLDVATPAPLVLEAIGRALADVRIWQADGALVELPVERAVVETKPGRPMTRIRLEGALPAGHYIVTAYGGESFVWSEGAAAQPFMLRWSERPALAAGAAEGVIGPFGAALFEAPASYDSFRLDIPQPAPVQLDALRGAQHETAIIGKNSRAPVATIRFNAEEAAPTRIQISGREGQAFALHAVHQSNYATFEAAGLHLVMIDVAGEGGDNVPATALLARQESDGKTRVIAASAPRIGPGEGWRGKFNVFGPTSLLFEATRDGPVAIDVKGVKLRARIMPALGALAPRADGRDATRYNLAAGYYFLMLEPQGEAGGVADVTLAPPGLAPALPDPPAPRAVISFGAQTLEQGGSYLAIANVAPDMLTGPRVVALPAALNQTPLALHQDAGQQLSLPLRIPTKGKIVARDEKGGAVALNFSDEKIENDQRLVSVTIAPTEKERAIGLTFVADATAPESRDSVKAPEKGATPRASVGRPAFFDLARDETKNLRFDVDQGGLYRVETLGRLKTALRIGAMVAPHLGEGDANGPGANGLVTTFLRAGAYRAAVTAKESNGHLGLAVTPATLTATAKITDAGDAHATLAPGKGAAVPFEITKAGDYALDIAGLKRDWRTRIEDADGWPLAPPGAMRRQTRHFDPGAYRLIVSPEDVEARVVVRLSRVTPTPALEGHGPHALPFARPQKLQWREPQAKGAPRTPDQWRFTLQGDADVEIDIGAGMIGEIIRNEKEPVGRVAGERPFKGELAAGAYRIDAHSPAYDDRLDYEISLSSKQLQPDAPRRVQLPAKLDFILAQESIVNLGGFGDKETIGVLKNAAGEIVERLRPRANDWNVAFAGRLPAGAYRLELEELGAPAAAPEETSDDTSAEAAQDDEETAGDEKPASGVELRLSILKEQDDGALAFGAETKLSGADAHRLRLPAARAGALMLVAAQSENDVAMSIERQDAGGSWRVIDVARGAAPAIAWPAPEDDSQWRAVVWPSGASASPITLTARITERRAGAGDIALDAVEGVTPALCIGKAQTPDAALVEISTTQPLVAGSAPGQTLQRAHAGALAPQSQALWLMTRGDCSAKAHVASFEWKGEEIALDIGAKARAQLPLLPAPKGKARLWLARAVSAQPAIGAGGAMGNTMGIAPGAALALQENAPPQLWNADGAGAMRAALRAIDVEMRAAVDGGMNFSGVIPPMSAQPVEMTTSDAPLLFDLAGGVAAFAGAQGVFGDGAALSRSVVSGANHILLVNLSDAPQAARVTRSAQPALRLDAGAVFKRYFPTSGEISAPFEARSGDRLMLIGAEATVVSRSGRIMRGRNLTLDGPGEAIISYKPGLVAAWIERDGASAWPQTTARAVTPPQRVTLEGAAMRFTIKADAPVMLRASSGAPAFIAFTQNGRRETLAFAAGVDFHHYLAPGDATLDIYAPHDGALSGALDIATQNIIDAHDGINDPVAVSSGGGAMFSFETKRGGDIGLGLRAEPDRATMRVLDASGKTLGDGVAQLLKLAPGRYFVEARLPPDAGAGALRLAIVGLSPPAATPPQEVLAELLEKAGMKTGKSK